MKIAINGKIVSDKEAAISVYDHGFMYGIGLFETFRTYGGRPFLLERHLQRLTDGCRDLGMQWRTEAREIERLVACLLHENGLRDGYFRLSVSAGDGELGLSVGPYERPTQVLYVKPLPPPFGTGSPAIHPGRALQRLALRRNSPEGDIRYKSFHYMNNILAKREMADYTWSAGAEGLFLSQDGSLAEGIVSNLFFVREGKLCTPSVELGILPGITRAMVLEWAQEEGWSCEQGRYAWDELVEADEVFLTNSIQEIVPVNRLYDEHGNTWDVSEPFPGPRSLRLMERYRQAVERMTGT